MKQFNKTCDILDERLERDYMYKNIKAFNEEILSLTLNGIELKYTAIEHSEKVTLAETIRICPLDSTEETEIPAGTVVEFYPSPDGKTMGVAIYGPRDSYRDETGGVLGVLNNYTGQPYDRLITVPR